MKKPSEPSNDIYLNARREWNERYGSYVAQARTWRLVAVAALGVAAVAVAGIAYIGSQSRIVPYVVRINKLGDAVAVGPAEVGHPVNKRVIVAQLAQWVVDVRSIYADYAAEHAIIEQAYSTIANQSPAQAAFNDYFRAHSPFDLAATETRSVQVHDVLPVSPHVYRVTWTETTIPRNASETRTRTWSALITIRISPPSTPAQIMRNPMGVLITDFTWSQRLS